MSKNIIRYSGDNVQKKVKILIIIFIIIFLIISIFVYLKNREKIKVQQEAKEKEIKSHYSNFVKTNKETKLYNCENNEVVGTLGANVETTLKKLKINYVTKYFIIDEFEEEYCVSYLDVDPIEKLIEKDSRYKLYIPFNENIITNDKTNFYNKESNLVYSFNKSYEFPIIIKDSDRYYVEFYNQLLYVKKEDVKELKKVNNSNDVKAKEVSVLCYHAIYDPNSETCNTEICHTEKQFNDHMSYLNTNNYMTLKMEEFEMFVDGKINIPKKSVLVTIDDGHMGIRSIPILEKNKTYATMFLITSWFSTEHFQSQYLELHSHSDDLHDPNECPGYGTQGSAILCKNHDYLVNDLKESRKKLNDSRAFCYPFYDYNDHAIKAIKDAGFTIAFTGGRRKAKIGENKYKIPRYTIVSYDTVNDLINIIN